MNKNTLQYLSIFENFQEKSTPNIIKKISNLIRKDLIINGDNSFNKKYSIDDFNLHIIIEYKKGKHQPYYSNVNIYNIIKNIEPIEIKVLVTDNKIDINYLMSIISHEIRHIYDIYTVVDDSEMIDFVKSSIVSKYKNENNFIGYVYLSLEHELIARHNMLYELYRWIEITDKDALYDIFKKSYTYKALTQLNTFDSVKFVNSENNLKLKTFTENFSKDIGDNFNGDLFLYYKNWEDFLKSKSNEFLSYVDKMLDDVISDVKNEKIYERLNGFISYNEDILSKLSYKLFDNLIQEKIIKNSKTKELKNDKNY